MAKQVQVTTAQVQAAQLLVSRSAKTGRFVAPEIRKIANAGQSTSTEVAPRPTS